MSYNIGNISITNKVIFIFFVGNRGASKDLMKKSP